MIRVEGLTVEVGERAFFRGLTTRFLAGRVTGIVGPNGSGKSTLLRALGAEDRPHAGAIKYGDDDAHALGGRARAARRAILFQSTELSFDFTLRELVDMSAFPFGDGGHPDVASVARRVGLEGAEARVVRTLSGGERQRALFGCALAQAELSTAAHPILLCDEPVAHQDPRWQLQIFELLREAADRGMVVVVVVHDLSLADRFCDDVLLLAEGARVAEGLASEVLRSEAVEQTFGVRVRAVAGEGGASGLIVERSAPASGGSAGVTAAVPLRSPSRRDPPSE